MNAIEFILAGMLAAATPFLLAALGELVVERAGVLNLGVEGLMAFGAALAFIIVHHGGGHFAGFVVAGLGSAALSLVFALIALGFRANQVATGLAIGILGQGLSALFGKSYESLTVKGCRSPQPSASGLFLPFRRLGSSCGQWVKTPRLLTP
jgi:simple sugar transport system permease protein